MRTLGIIKPDAVERGATGFILMSADLAGFKIVNMRWIHMNEHQAGRFYREHEGKPFYEKLVKFMSSGPCVVLSLELKPDDDGDGDTITRWRTFMKRIREIEASKEYSERNAVHGSDSVTSAFREHDFFFGGDDPSDVDLLD